MPDRTINRERLKRPKRRPRGKDAKGNPLPRDRRTLFERLQDPGVVSVALSWAAAGMSNADISRMLGCSADDALAKLFKTHRNLGRRFWRARQNIKADAIDGLRDKFKRDWRACAWYLERQHRDEYGIANANAVDLRKLFTILTKLAGDIRAVIPEANREAVDSIMAEFVDRISQDGDAPDLDGEPAAW
jgi:hypothetical protein